MNRTIAPEVKPLNYFEIQQTERRSISNGVPLFLLNNGTQPLIRLEVIFEAGSKYEKVPSAAFLISKMLQEGTEKYTATQLQETIASLGAFMEINQGVERINFTFYLLNKSLHEFLPILEEILLRPTFPKENFDNIVSITKNTLKVNLEKSSVLASQELKKHLFGANHYYGYSVNEKDLEAISINDLKEHYITHILNAPYEVFVSGLTNESVSKAITNFFQNISPKSTVKPIKKPLEGVTSSKELISKPTTLQSSIRLGKVIFNRQHPDYFKMLVVNEILGGYFGSRLMKNIREEKGLTYGISSQVVSLEETGYFVIGTDVKKENTQLALNEIYKEIEILKTELVPADELDTVINYMHGSFLGSLNSAFALMDKFKTIHYAHKEYTYFADYIKALKSITSEQIRETAQHYFSDFTEIVVGNYE